MTRDEFMRVHWKYYLLLEEDFEKTTRYVELDQANFLTFSKEYYKLFMPICMEVEALMKAISGVAPSIGDNISKFGTDVLKNIPALLIRK